MTILRWFISQTVRNACAVRKHYQRLLDSQIDILKPAQIAAVKLKIAELSTAIAGGKAGEMNLKAEELQSAAENNLYKYPNPVWRENAEVLLVALAVAMGIRTFFLQPFKIPTGSMQPTLFGVTATPDYSRPMAEYNYYSQHNIMNEAVQEHIEAEMQPLRAQQAALVIPSAWQRCKEWFQGVTYVHFVAPVDGKFEAATAPWPGVIFSLYQRFKFAGEWHIIWFPPDYGDSDLVSRAGILPDETFKKGDDVIKLRAVAGDHLFVDRLTYNFRRPDRGDTVVFATIGIPEEQRLTWRIDGGQFYIKRLVGLPGEKVQIGDDRHLIINGKRLDDTTPHFENLYGFDPKQPPRESQWSGHLNGTVAQENNLNMSLPLFPNADAVFEVPSNNCIVMGDNTCNSLDSRFWGSIPEDYIIGKSFFVYWPLTSRFGWGNH